MALFTAPAKRLQVIKKNIYKRQNKIKYNWKQNKYCLRLLCIITHLFLFYPIKYLLPDPKTKKEPILRFRIFTLLDYPIDILAICEFLTYKNGKLYNLQSEKSSGPYKLTRQSILHAAFQLAYIPLVTCVSMFFCGSKKDAPGMLCTRN